MNKILVEVSVGELLDKISILEIKKEKISDASFLENINTEYSILKEQLEKNIQNDKRTYEKNSDFGEKFIKVSRDVHFLNDKRARIKLEINNQSGSKIKEIKQYTKY